MEKRLTLLLNKNGSIEVVPQDVSTNTYNWIPTVCLLLGFCFGAGLSLLTLLGLRTKLCPRALIGLQIAALLDYVQGHILGVVFLAIKPNSSWCRLSACTSTALLVIETVEVMLLTFPLQSPHFWIAPWVIGLFIGLLIMVDYQLPVNFYPSRYSCSVVIGQHGWLSMIMILILGTSWLGSASGIIYSAIFREKNLDIIVSRIISLFYIILVLPTALMLLISISIKPLVTNNNDIAQSIFTWGRYQFNLLIPIIILLFYKQVRKESMNALCWCRKNSIGFVNKTTNNTNNPLHIIPKRALFKQNRNRKSDSLTPVLFATSNGLHLRTVDKNNWSTTTLLCEPCDLKQGETSTPKTATLLREFTTDHKKNVRFASPLDCDIPLSESGVWSNTEDRLQVQTENEKEINDLGVTFTKV